MKKIIIVIVLVISIILLDSVQALVFNNNPILKIRKNYNGGDIFYKDLGFLVDTYKCANNKKTTIIKGFSYSCSTSSDFQIVDKTLEIKDFSCAEVLEEIYKDSEYTYYLSCMKSKYIEVRYSNSSKENIVDALGNNHIKINDLDKFDINYIKIENEN